MIDSYNEVYCLYIIAPCYIKEVKLDVKKFLFLKIVVQV